MRIAIDVRLVAPPRPREKPYISPHETTLLLVQTSYARKLTERIGAATRFRVRIAKSVGISLPLQCSLPDNPRFL